MNFVLMHPMEVSIGMKVFYLRIKNYVRPKVPLGNCWSKCLVCKSAKARANLHGSYTLHIPSMP
ncbi:hypothetical protein CR513_26487, partial [Mucuna pruriens]